MNKNKKMSLLLFKQRYLVYSIFFIVLYLISKVIYQNIYPDSNFDSYLLEKLQVMMAVYKSIYNFFIFLIFFMIGSVFQEKLALFFELDKWKWKDKKWTINTNIKTYGILGFLWGYLFFIVSSETFLPFVSDLFVIFFHITLRTY